MATNKCSLFGSEAIRRNWYTERDRQNIWLCSSSEEERISKQLHAIQINSLAQLFYLCLFTSAKQTLRPFGFNPISIKLRLIRLIHRAHHDGSLLSVTGAQLQDIVSVVVVVVGTRLAVNLHQLSYWLLRLFRKQSKASKHYLKLWVCFWSNDFIEIAIQLQEKCSNLNP